MATWSFIEKTDFTMGDTTPGGKVDSTATPFSSAEKATILAAMQTAYDGSSVARTMFENWIVAGKRFTFSHITNDFYVYPTLKNGIAYLDLNFIKELDYIDDHGNAVRHTATDAIIHELGHALTARVDNPNDTNYYTGENVDFVNTIFAQLGFPKEIAYHAQSWDVNSPPIASPDWTNLFKTGYAYTNGTPITAALAAYRPDLTTGGTDDLLVGGPGSNVLSAGAATDFLVGAGGKDILHGGAGTDTAVYFDPNPADYDIRTADHGATWTIRHVRGDGLVTEKSDGTDTLDNIEVLQFDRTQHYALKTGSLAFETDFALVIDTTGSMGTSIDAVKAKAGNIIDSLFASGKIDAQIAVVGFKDTTNGEPSTVILPFTTQDSFVDRKAAAIAAINSISVGGGGDLPETDNDGLITALNLSGWRIGAGVHRIALFTDAAVKDTALASQVDALAKNLGAVITSHAAAGGAGGSVDTFSLSFSSFGSADATGTEGLVSPSDGPPLPTFIPASDPTSPDATSATLQVFTIFTGSAGTDTSGLSDIATRTGGSLLNAASGDDLVKALLDIINIPPDQTIVGTSADDTIDGSAGNDTIFAGAGHDTVHGLAGNDTIVGNADIFAKEADVLDGGNGNDIIYGEFTDTIQGGPGFDILYAVNAYDWSIDLGATSIELFIADFGNDTITAATQTVGVEVVASGGNDTVTGSAFDDRLWGGTGNDVMHGGGGNDMLFGDVGADQLFGDAGNDIIYADSNDTVIDGGAGFDVVYITTGPGVTVNMAAQGIEFLIDLAGGTNVINAAGMTVGANIYTGAGNDTITGSGLDDVLWGQGGADIIAGGAGADVLVGGTGADVLTGGAGNDRIYMNSGGGNDGAADRAVFAAGWGRDNVYDFTHGSDKLDLTALHTSFGALTITASAGNAVVTLGADQIILAGLAGTMTAADFTF